MFIKRKVQLKHIALMTTKNKKPAALILARKTLKKVMSNNDIFYGDEVTKIAWPFVNFDSFLVKI